MDLQIGAAIMKLISKARYTLRKAIISVTEWFFVGMHVVSVRNKEVCR